MRIGDDPVKSFLIENHDEALHIWRDAGVKNKVLVHIDAHHDMWWKSEKSTLTIANYISKAMADDIVKQVFWIAPDQTWKSSGTRRAIRRHLKRIAEKYPKTPQDSRLRGDEMSMIVMGKSVKVCPMKSLPIIDEPVLLDIDVDFMTIPYVSYGRSDKIGRLPWCWPKELAAILNVRGLQADLVTIAYSVEGGYTPLEWKYLGDELQERLLHPREETPRLLAMDLIGEGAVCAGRGLLSEAEKKYREAERILPGSAAALVPLARLLCDRGQIEEARILKRRALESDPSYRTAYNGRSLRFHHDRRFRKEKSEHLRILRLDPQDPFAHFGLGRLAARKRDWKEAEQLLRRSLELFPDFMDAYYVLGHISIKQGRDSDAIESYARYLKLALHGHGVLDGIILTAPQDSISFKDPNHCEVHAKLARLYAKTGAVQRAINGYRISIAGGNDGVLIRYRLARLYLRRKQWPEFRKEAWQTFKAISRITRTVKNAGRVFCRRLRQYWRNSLNFLFHHAD